MLDIIERLKTDGATYEALAEEVSRLTGRPVERVKAEAEERAHSANDARTMVNLSLPKGATSFVLPAVTRLEMLERMKQQALAKQFSRNGHR